MTKKLQILKLDKDERVSRSGFYEMGNERYQEDCADAPSISSSGLVKISDSPKEFWDTSIYNPDPAEETRSPYMNMGIAAHELILEGDLSDGRYALRPSSMKSWRSKDAQQWRKFREAEGKMCLTSEDLDNLEGMAEAILQHPQASDIFKSGLIEASLFAKIGKVWVKGRPDIIPFRTLSAQADYKTSNDVSPGGMRRAVRMTGADQKLANVTMLMGMLIPGFPPIHEITHSLIFQQTKRPWSINILPIDTGVIRTRISQNYAAIKTFEKNIEAWKLNASHIWPDRDVDFDDIYTLPDYQHEKLRNRISSGEWPSFNEDYQPIDLNTGKAWEA